MVLSSIRLVKHVCIMRQYNRDSPERVTVQTVAYIGKSLGVNGRSEAPEASSTEAQYSPVRIYASEKH